MGVFRITFLGFVACVLSVTSAPLAAETLLTVVTSKGSEIELSFEDLEALDQTAYSTANDYVDGETEFSGPLVRDLVAMMGGEPAEILFTAINDYAITIPVSDFVEYDVILAIYQDGQKLSRRAKGPIWVIYPTSQFEALQDRVHNDRLIWQLVRMEAQ